MFSVANQKFFFSLLLWFGLATILIQSVAAQYEDVRCKCICPSPNNIVNGSTKSNRKLYIGNVAATECNCDFVVLPQLDQKVQDKAKEFCPRCECKYESRDTSIIRFFVIFIIGIISFLTIYMVFLMILDPWIHKRNIRTSYVQHIDEEVSLEEQNTSESLARRRVAPTISPIQSSPEGTPKGVLNRVGHSQTKWKRQVKEQRKNIYDDHSMLN